MWHAACCDMLERLCLRLLGEPNRRQSVSRRDSHRPPDLEIARIARQSEDLRSLAFGKPFACSTGPDLSCNAASYWFNCEFMFEQAPLRVTELLCRSRFHLLLFSLSFTSFLHTCSTMTGIRSTESPELPLCNIAAPSLSTTTPSLPTPPILLFNSDHDSEGFVCRLYRRELTQVPPCSPTYTLQVH